MLTTKKTQYYWVVTRDTIVISLVRPQKAMTKMASAPSISLKTRLGLQCHTPALSKV